MKKVTFGVFEYYLPKAKQEITDYFINEVVPKHKVILWDFIFPSDIVIEIDDVAYTITKKLILIDSLTEEEAFFLIKNIKMESGYGM